MVAKGETGSRLDQRARAEFLLRQTQYQERATRAAEETAAHTRKYTKYMFWSVLLLGLSVLGKLIVQALTAWGSR